MFIDYLYSWPLNNMGAGGTNSLHSQNSEYNFFISFAASGLSCVIQDLSSWCKVSVFVVLALSCSASWVILVPWPGMELGHLHCNADFQPLDHQENPWV